MNNYQPVIGLEIHIELKTSSKMFCQCSASYFGKPANTQVCPVCLGMPGALPVANKKAIEWTILIGKALNCQINSFSKFDRKHYFYPDLPKGYQISQYDEPIASNGWVKIAYKDQAKNGLTKKIFRIRRVHLEEDTGKLIHSKNGTLIDFNRSGVPLVEIVTEPDFDNSKDVKRFLEELQVIVRYLGVSDADMEKGTMRMEPNISIKSQKSKVKSQKFPNYKVEIKNINSFRFVKQAIDYEIKRQIEILKSGKIPTQETRGFNAEKQITYPQRTKEEAADYRYFPEPDIPPLFFNQEYIDAIKVPELPSQKIKKYISDFGIRFEDAFILTRDKKTANYFEEVSQKLIDKLADKIQNQVILSQKLNLKIQNLNQTIANYIINKKISTQLPVEEFINKLIENLKPKEVDKELLSKVIDKVLKNNPKPVEDYQKGKTNAIMFLVGQVMKEMNGKAEAKIVREEIERKIKR
jgi:aspartyl-tRNA(Asn)/glutamyl-tRNA(Gln) amidotransferase subunit B